MPIVIDGGKDKMFETYLRYSNASDKAILKYDINPTRDNLKKFCFLGTKCVISYQEPRDMTRLLAESLLGRFFILEEQLSLLTPKEFMQLFPITKVYDGRKLNLVDYFTVKEKVDKLNQDEPIKNQLTGAWELITSYLNDDINKLLLVGIRLMSYLQMFDGKKSIAEIIEEDFGVEIINNGKTNLRVLK